MWRAVDVILALGEEDLQSLHSVFEDVEAEHGRGLYLKEFLDAITRYLTPRDDSPEAFAELAAGLYELFEEIDINGDGALSWDEFTAFCIESGLIQLRETEPQHVIEEYRESSQRDRTSAYTIVNKIEYNARADLILTSQSGATTAALLSSDMRLVHNFTQPVVSRDDPVLQVLAATFLPERDQVALSCSDKCVYLYSLDDYSCTGKIQTHAIQSAILWVPTRSVILLADRTGAVKAFDVDSGLAKATLKHVHGAQVTCLVLVPQAGTVATGSMDGTLALYDIESPDYRYRGRLRGHSKGVRGAVYSAEHGLLFSASFDTTGRGWDLGSRHDVIRMRGHHYPLVGVDFVPGSPMPLAVTADTMGIARVWDVRRGHSGGAVCLQTVTLDPGNTGFEPRCIASLAPEKQFIVGGSRIRKFKSYRLRREDMAPTFALQNERTGDFVVGHGPAVRVFNGSAGTETAVFRSGAADLTCGAFDLRGRKLAVADQAGSVRVLNMMNGAVLKQQQVHRGEVTSIHYCSVDNIIISTGYDRRIAVMDEDSPDALPILRTVDGASPDPISCSTYHRQLSLIVIGSASGELRVFDMQDLKPLIVHAAHAQDIAALISLPDRAVLFSTDLGATVSMWQIVDRQELRSLGTFHNLAPPPSPPPSPGKDGDEDGDFSFLTGPSEAVAPPGERVAVSSLVCMPFNGGAEPALHLVTGDDRGRVRICDVTESVLEAVDPLVEEERLADNPSYNPRRVFHHRLLADGMLETHTAEEGEGGAPPSPPRGDSPTSAAKAPRRRTQRRAPPPPSTSSRRAQGGDGPQTTSPKLRRSSSLGAYVVPLEMECIREGKLHEGCVRHVYVTMEGNLLTTGLDGVSRLYSSELALLSELDPEMVRREVKMQQGTLRWSYAPNFGARGAEARRTALALLEDVREERKQRELEEARRKERKRSSILRRRGSHLSTVQGSEAPSRPSTRRSLSPDGAHDPSFTLVERGPAEEGHDVSSPDDAARSRLAAATASLRAMDTMVQRAGGGDGRQPARRDRYGHLEVETKKKMVGKVNGPRKLPPLDTRPSEFVARELGLGQYGKRRPRPQRRQRGQRGLRKGNHAASAPVLPPLGDGASSDQAAGLGGKQLHRTASGPALHGGGASRPTLQPVGSTSNLPAEPATWQSSLPAHATHRGHKPTVLAHGRVNTLLQRMDQAFSAAAASPKRAASPLKQRGTPLSSAEAATLRSRAEATQRRVEAVTGALTRRGRGPNVAKASPREEESKHNSLAPYMGYAQTAYELYRDMDADHSGSVNVFEFMKAMGSTQKQTGDRNMALELASQVDSDGNGTVSFSELLRYLFGSLTEAEIDALEAHVRANALKDLRSRKGQGKLPPAPKREAHVTAQQLNDARDMFHLFDADRSGTISVPEFVAIMEGNVLGEGDANMNAQEVLAICKSYDTDGDGEIDFEEFLNMFRQLFLLESEKERRNNSDADARRFLTEDASK